MSMSESEYRKQEHDLKTLIRLNANNEEAKLFYEEQLKKLKKSR